MNLQEQPTGRLMLLAFRQFEESLLQELQQRGYMDVTLSHLNVIRHLDPQGLNLHHLARDAALSKQATSKIVADLEFKGYVSCLPDPLDRRAKRIQYRPRGEALMANAVKIVNTLERTYLSLLGEEYHVLRRALIHIYQYHTEDSL